MEEDAEGALPAKSKSHLTTLRGRVRRLERLLDDILEYSRIENKLNHVPFELVDGDTLMQDVESLVSHGSTSTAGGTLKRAAQGRRELSCTTPGGNHSSHQ